MCTRVAALGCCNYYHTESENVHALLLFSTPNAVALPLRQHQTFRLCADSNSGVDRIFNQDVRGLHVTSLAQIEIDTHE